MKPHFTKLYRDEKHTLKYTMDRLRELYGFKATEKMYKTHIKKWGLEKYNKDEELLHLIRLDRDSPPAKNRSYTINGRPTTVEDAKRHFRRKKVKSLDDLIARLPSQIPDTITVIYEDDEDGQQPFPDFNTPEFDAPDFMAPVHDQEMTAPHLILDTDYHNPYDTEVMDMNMDDRMTLSPDEFPIDPTARFPYFNGIEPADNEMEQENAGALALFRPRKPSLITTPGLQFATESFLHNISDFSNMIVDSILAEPVEYHQVRRFNKLWDLFCTTSVHIRENRTMQALRSHDEARVTFSRMLQVRDPWLLLSLCLVLNDNLSNENRVSARPFLNDMSKWTNKFAADHPIVRLVRDLQNTSDRTSDRASYLLEATVRMISERLNETVGRTHDLSLELSRLHARTLTTVGMHSIAETLLSQDLAMVERVFGARSLQNFLRLSALARARYVAEDYSDALRLYQNILTESEGWVDESSLADIKYGAMYFIAKSHAKLGNYEAANHAALGMLRFAMQQQGPEHYWTSNARELINELSLGGDRIMEMDE